MLLDKRAAIIFSLLAKAYPNARCALLFNSPFQLLVATILSAQCTDKRVNIVTPPLFERYPDAANMARARVPDIERMIRSAGYFRSKARYISGCARMIMAKFDGKVPRTMDELLTLPGVARKTANVVLGVGFGINDGVCVDTHVLRLAQRLALFGGALSGSPTAIVTGGAFSGAARKTPEKVERDLMQLFPRRNWTRLSTLLIAHGRAICRARKPSCETCVLAKHCPGAFRV